MIKTILEICSSSITGNVLGIISIILTWRTMVNVKMIKEEKERAIDKNNFNTHKIDYEKSLREIQRAINNQQTISKEKIRSTIAILNKIRVHDKIINQTDLDIILLYKRRLEDMELNYELNEKVKYIQEIDNDISGIIGILEKGEYNS